MKRKLLIILLLSILFVHAYAQRATFSGVVTNGSGNSLSGVTIIDQSSQKFVGSTNISGKFKVNVEVGTKLLFRYLGFKHKVVEVKSGMDNIEIKLVEEANKLDDAVVVGYVAKKKESLTGSAVVINSKDIKDAPAANFSDLLQGRVTGLNVQLNTGTPGVAGMMSIRGVNSAAISGTGPDAFVSNTSPLFVIDGVPVEQADNFEYGFQTQGPGMSPLSMIPVEDIEDITVLKDAQATALYGSKGAYGVILVRTKRGNSKVPIVSLQSKFYFNTVPKLRNVLGGRDERHLRVEQILGNDTSMRSALNIINQTPILADSLNNFYNNSTNWQAYSYRNTVNMDQVIMISGGDQSFNYKVTPAYSKQVGIISNTGFSRYAISSNFRYSPGSGQKFVIMANMNAGMVRNSFGSGNAYQQGGVANAGNRSTLLPAPSIAAGSFDALLAAAMVNDNKTANAKAMVEFEYEFLKGLRAVSTFSYAYDIANQDRFTPELLNSGENLIYVFNSRRNTLYNRNLIRYTLPVGQKQLINAYVFNEIDVSKFRPEAMRIRGTGSDQIQSGLSYNVLGSDGGVLNSLSERKTIGYAANFSYQYDSKYIMDVSYRWDGSSIADTFGKWSTSPSLGIRWNFQRERWFENLDWFTNGNTRLTWGVNTIPVGTIYDAAGRYRQDIQTYNGLPSVSIDFSNSPNTNLGPVRTTQWNYGLELGFLQDRIRINYETYYKQVDDGLTQISLPNTAVFAQKSLNLTSVVNKGHELSLTIRPNFNNANWNATFYINSSLNVDRLTKFNGKDREDLQKGKSGINGSTNVSDYPYSLRRIGRNTFTNVLFNYMGVYQTDEEVPVNPATGLRYRAGALTDEFSYFRAGDPIFTDLNGDYILDEKDLVYTGNSQPQFTGGFGATVRYKEWSMQPNFVYSLKRDIMNIALADKFRNYYDPTNDRVRVPLDQYNFFDPSRITALFPDPMDFRRANIVNPFRYPSTMFQEDGSFLKLSSLTIGYNFRRDFIQRHVGLTGLRLYLTGSNLYTLSRYSGPDPELVTALGYDNSSGYPRARTYTFGLDIQF